MITGSHPHFEQLVILKLLDINEYLMGALCSDIVMDKYQG